MRRRLSSAAVLLSALLFALVVAAFVRSLWRTDQLSWTHLEDAPPVLYRWYVVVQSGGGGFEVARDAEVYDLRALSPRNPERNDLRGWQFEGHGSAPPHYPRPAFRTFDRAKLGFWFKWIHTPDTVRHEIILPYWFLAILGGILPSLWLVRRRRESVRRRRAAAGLCSRCGYDLRASGDTCSECGAPVERRAA
jgi:hypothetical protein